MLGSFVEGVCTTGSTANASVMIGGSGGSGLCVVHSKRLYTAGYGHLRAYLKPKLTEWSAVLEVRKLEIPVWGANPYPVNGQKLVATYRPSTSIAS